jgi:hypothetical protein
MLLYDQQMFALKGDLMAGPTSRPFLKSFACAAVTIGLTILALFVFLGSPKSDDGAAQSIGYVFMMSSVTALGTGFVAQRAKTAWPLWRIIVTYLAIFLAIAVISAMGRQRQHP